MDRDGISDWPQGWAPRSAPYREGFRAGFSLIPTACPYAAGAVESDAWYAGYDHGKLHKRLEGGR